MVMISHEPFTPPPGEFEAVRAGADAWRSWSELLQEASRRLLNVSDGLTSLEGESANAAIGRLNEAAARAIRMAQVLELAERTLVLYAVSLENGCIQTLKANIDDLDAHEDYERDILKGTDGSAAEAAEQVAGKLWLEALESTKEAALSASAPLDAFNVGPEGLPLPDVKTSPQTNAMLVVAYGCLNVLKNQNLGEEERKALQDQLIRLVDARGNDLKFLEAVFEGGKRGDMYLAMAYAGLYKDNIFVDKMIDAAARIGIPRANIAARESYYLMMEWRDTDKFNEMVGATDSPVTLKMAGVDPNLQYFEQRLEIIGKFAPKQEWDAKPYLDNVLEQSRLPNKTLFQRLDMGNGKEINYDVFGNYVFGYMAAEMGLGIEEANEAASIPLFGKTDAGDEVAVELGYELYKLHPRGLSSREFEDHLFSTDTLDQLTRNDKVFEKR